ncbi:helix-turn-helix transcriptional regulator [Paraburkholderia sp. MM6662-R1]|uniref:helix-turn-helix transcriptional regulator n=1 Tax=Paraburkholderia sp. MM6662-R1 TaxID=2991066 RepID=UPI003D1D26FF
MLFEAAMHVTRDRVALQLWRNPDMSCVLERQLVRADGVTMTQILLAADRDTLQEFIAADPYGEHLRPQYESLCRIHREQLESQSGRPAARQRPCDPLDQIGRVRGCPNEAELMAIISGVLLPLGAQSYTYRWLHVDERTGAIDGQRCLIGCHPGWIHAYISHQWYRTDPVIEYARKNGALILAGDIESFGDDGRAREAAAQYGFRSAIVCPAHRPSGTLIGLLQAGNELPQPEGERVLWQDRSRALLRSLTEEILEWRIVAQREEEASRIDLDPRERIVLRLVRAGRTACNVADSLGLSERTVYDIFKKINRKLGVSHITRAAAMATDKGLIE